VRNTVNQSSANWRLGQHADPCEDLEGFRHRADEVAESLRSEDISAMKIWPA